MLLSVLVVGSSVVVASCTQDNETPTSSVQASQEVRHAAASASEVREARENGRRTGAQHNEAMELVRKRIMVASHKKGAPLTTEEAYAVLQETLNAFFTSKGYQGVGRSDVSQWRDRISKHGNNGPALAAGFSTASSDVALSDQAHAYLNEIVSLADQAGYYGYDWLSSELMRVESAASGTLAGVDLEAVYAISSVALSSAAYWPSYSDDWYRMCGSQLVCDESGGGMTIQRVSMGWRVLASDVVGGIGGFMLSGPPGALVGAAVASSCAIIAEL